jgi:glycerol kinase
LLWNLTGGRADRGAVHATDVSNASRTMLFDIRSMHWSAELCELFGVPAGMLGDVLPSSGRFGVTADGTPGVGGGIPISGIGGDQQAALFGQACFEPGMTKNTYGTGSFVLMNVGTERPEPVDGLLTTIAWGLPDPAADEPDRPPSAEMQITYAYEGAIFVTGAAVQWLRDELGIIESSAEVGPLAASVDGTDGVVVVPAFAGLGSPWWDPYARGTILGITRGTSRAHIARAVVEAMAFQTRDVVEAMERSSGRAVRALRADGGASAMPLLLQLQADQLQVPVARPAVLDTTALGAAYLAGLAEGMWTSLDDLAANWELEVEVRPAADADQTRPGYERWLTAVQRSRSWATG